jgi:hypothetical protein
MQCVHDGSFPSHLICVIGKYSVEFGFRTCAILAHFLLPAHVTSSSYPPPLRTFCAPHIRFRRRLGRVEHRCRCCGAIPAVPSVSVPEELLLTWPDRRRRRELHNVRHARGRYRTSLEVATAEGVLDGYKKCVSRVACGSPTELQLWPSRVGRYSELRRRPM